MAQPEQVIVAATRHLDLPGARPEGNSRRRGPGTGQQPELRVRTRELVRFMSTRPPWPTQLRLTAVNAWRWLAHNVRVALAGSGEIERGLSADPGAMRALIRRTRLALVTTRDRAGALHSEPMEATDREFDGELWFAARESSEILDRVRTRAAVQVTYLDELSNRCVVLDGIARVCSNPGRDDVSTIIRIDIMSADVWE